MSMTQEFSGPAVGYGRASDGEHAVHLYACNCFLSTKTARELATDLLIWAERIDARNGVKREDGGKE